MGDVNDEIKESNIEETYEDTKEENSNFEMENISEVLNIGGLS